LTEDNKVFELKPVTEIESLCMQCEENGTTRLLLTKIPHFKEIVVMAFECPHCGLKNNEVQSAAAVAEQGHKQVCTINKPEDLNRQVIKSEWGTVRFEELDFEIPSESQRGILSTVDGILDRAIEGLSQEQPQRKELYPDIYEQIERVIQILKDYQSGKQPFTFVLDDPSGNSFIENLNAPNADPKIKDHFYNRTKEMNQMMGFATEEPDPDALALVEEVHVFPGNCSRCNYPSDTKMHMLDIPHFKQVIVMATVCESCGYKSNEVKAGGAVAEKGRRITLKMTDAEDLNRDILKSETCGLSIPEIELELTPGTLGGRFTTIEGLLTQVKEELESRSSMGGDSATPEQKQRYANFFAKLDQVLAMQGEFTIVLDDPLANSHLQNLYAPDPDPNMTIEDYERTFEQNEDFGLNDMVTENY
ncbi:ZPR1 zinc-finger domain-containing protein, partial [Gorgonomyces haynaldii]